MYSLKKINKNEQLKEQHKLTKRNLFLVFLPVSEFFGICI